MKYFTFAGLLLGLVGLVTMVTATRVIYFNHDVAYRNLNAKIFRTPNHVKQCDNAMLGDRFGICRKTAGY
jgi:hypothetical protein